MEENPSLMEENPTLRDRLVLLMDHGEERML
jgi:hypothetical protein